MSIFRKYVPRSILATWIQPLVSPLLPAATQAWILAAAGTFDWHPASNGSPARVPDAIGEMALSNTGVTGLQSILFNQAGMVRSTTYASGPAAPNPNGGVLRLSGNATAATAEEINGLNLRQGAFNPDIVTVGQNATIAPGGRNGTGLRALALALATAAGGSNPRKINVNNPLQPLPAPISSFSFLG
jgi:hypothetical protein